MSTFRIIRKFFQYFSLRTELDDAEEIHNNIVKGILFRGTNLWILMFAIIVASVGLNMNSIPVIIGAMLISPLMGPINGMGYSMATYNYPLFRQAFKNFGFAVGASILASTLYFVLTPISTAHSELLARTNPTIYDVLIALFGGFAGIVAMSSQQKGNVIPGVAIATALMPPLCTAGYGLATAKLDFFLGAMYLFTINTVFIGLAALMVSQMLKFPIRTLVNASQKKVVNRWISLVLVLVLIPSIYFGYKLVQSNKFEENANRYITNVSQYEGSYLLKSQVNANKRQITLVYGGVSMHENQKARLTEKAQDFKLHDAKINIKQGLALDVFDVKSTEVETLRAQLNKMNLDKTETERKLDSLIKLKMMGRTLLNEIRNLYPQISSCSYAETFLYSDTLPQPRQYAVIIFSLKNKKMTDEEEMKIENWLKTRLNTSRLKIFYE
jgi:uncharacterized hydrophobic protein (TIGR00271 family)